MPFDIFSIVDEPEKLERYFREEEEGLLLANEANRRAEIARRLASAATELAAGGDISRILREIDRLTASLREMR